MSASKNDHETKHTVVEHLRGLELDGFIKHAQNIMVFFLMVS